MKFDCERFSCFPDERETLFFGGDTELRIKGIMQWFQGRWRHYDKFMEPINALNRMINGRRLEHQSIWNSRKSQKWMNCIIRDHLYHQLSQRDKVETPQYVSSLVSYQMSSTEHIRLNWNEMKSGYEWMNSIVKLDNGHLDIGNIAVLFADSSSITFVVWNGVDLEEAEWKSVVNELSVMYSMGLWMTIRFELSSDEYAQQNMHQMAVGYLDMEESKWQCQHDANVLIFNIADATESEKQSEFLRKRGELLIQRLEEQLSQDLVAVVIEEPSSPYAWQQRSNSQRGLNSQDQYSKFWRPNSKSHIE